MLLEDNIKFLENRLTKLEAAKNALFADGNEEFFNCPYDADIESTRRLIEQLKTLIQ